MPVTPAAIAGPERPRGGFADARAPVNTDTCRLTIAGPAGRADLTVPATVTLGELLPMILHHVTEETGRVQPWVLQRAGEEPLDADQTPETLDLHEGDVLYLRAAPDAMPALVFDDIAAGVADEVSGRPDRWRPAFTRWLLLGLAGVALAAFLAGVSLAHLQRGQAVTFGLAAAITAVVSILTTRLLRDIGTGLLTGMAAVVFAVAEGLTTDVSGAPETASRLALTFSSTNVVLAGFSAAAAAAAVLLASRAAPATPYLAVLTAALAAVAGGWLVTAAHMDATQAMATLAVGVFMAGTLGLRLALRIARLRMPYPPANAEELQLDIAPEPGARLRQRTAAAVRYLNGLTAGSAMVCLAAFVQLATHPSWPGWLLSALLGAALLLRARIVAGVWQRACLAAAGALGIALALVSVAARADASAGLAGLAALAALPVAAAGLLAGARGLPGRRMLPTWEQAADVLDVVIALALVPVLLELAGVFSLLRSMIG
jgi:type VII secretion integral membrane protein EccD